MVEKAAYIISTQLYQDDFGLQINKWLGEYRRSEITSVTEAHKIQEALGVMYDEPKHHHVKAWPEYFQAIINGTKTFEVRVNDRGYMEGDHITIEEWCPNINQYTGRISEHVIGYVLRGGNFDIPNHLCVFSLIDL
jgi:hypothetical protein